jgi:hypothetical protein
MDDGETQESLTMSLSNAEDAPPSLPKMHSLVQCGTENYWEIESSGENWLRFIKASSNPPFESQASDESEQESNKSKVFATIASTEPRTQSSIDSAAKEMIIQLEVCSVTDIGYLLAVKAMEDSHGKLYAVRKEDYTTRSRKLLTHRELHLMRPGDKICYVQSGDELLMEYKCETVIETSPSQNLGRESLSYLDNTQQTEVPITQRDVRKSHDGVFFTQDPDPDDPYSQPTQEAVVPPKTDISSHQAIENVEAIDDANMSQASSGDTTIDPDEVQEDKISPKGAQSLKRARESPMSVDTEDDNGESGPKSMHKEPPRSAKLLKPSAQSLNDQDTPARDEMKESSGSQTVQSVKKTPIGDEVENISDLIVCDHNGSLKAAPTLEQPPELMNDREPPTKDDFAKRACAQPQRENANKFILSDEIEESSDILVSELVKNDTSKVVDHVKHSPAVMKDRETEPSGSQTVRDKAKETPKNDNLSNAVKDPVTPGGEVEESPGLFAPTQPADLFSEKLLNPSARSLNDHETPARKETKESPRSQTVQSVKKTPIGNAVEDISDLLAFQLLHNHNGSPKAAPTPGQAPDLMNDRETPSKVDFAESPGAKPQLEKAKKPSFGGETKESELLVSELVKGEALNALNLVKTGVMKGGETETSGFKPVKREKAKKTPVNDRSPNARINRETPGGEVEESPGLFAPTQPADLYSAATNGELGHPSSPDITQIKKHSAQSSTPKRASVVSEKMTPLKSRSEPVRMTRSRTGSAVKQPRSGGKNGKGPQILVTGYEVDSIMEEVGPMITINHDQYPFSSSHPLWNLACKQNRRYNNT